LEPAQEIERWHCPSYPKTQDLNSLGYPKIQDIKALAYDLNALEYPKT
jgi:hypothetical protein